MKQLEEDNRSWEEKTEDFDGDFDFVEEENEDGTTSVVLKRAVTCQRRKKTECAALYTNREGVEYPLDIWFLISEYIQPEDVRRFGGICRSTYTVVCSAKFWFSLYKRFYKNVNLPERLQPECMVRKYGLKACVVRSLHFMYPLFVNRIKAVTTFEEHPHNLMKRQCVLMWHAKRKDKWLYFFKLKENVNYELRRKQQQQKPQQQQQPDLIEMLDDVLANTEEGCRILQVSCPHFVPIPLVLGLTLTAVSLTLSQGFRHHRLQMAFGSGLSYMSRPVDSSSCVEVVLDPVINVRVLDWWHPLYPHSQTTPVLNQGEIEISN